MSSSELYAQIDLINESDLNDRAMRVYEWLRPGDMKSAIQDLFDLINLQNDLIELMRKDLIDLRIEKSGERQKFYPMSFTPRRRR